MIIPKTIMIPITAAVMNCKIYLAIVVGIIIGYSLNVKLQVEEKTIQDHSDNGPAHTEKLEDGTSEIILSSKAAERLDIQTLSVSKTEWTIPYSAVVYDVYGKTWVYENSEPLTYGRKEISIRDVVDLEVVLYEQLQHDIVIVTVGVPELYGVEVGIGQGAGGH